MTDVVPTSEDIAAMLENYTTRYREVSEAVVVLLLSDGVDAIARIEAELWDHSQNLARMWNEVSHDRVLAWCDAGVDE